MAPSSLSYSSLVVEDQEAPRSPASMPRDLTLIGEAKKGQMASGLPPLSSPSLYIGGRKPLSYASLQKTQEEHAGFSTELASLKARFLRLQQCAVATGQQNDTDEEQAAAANNNEKSDDLSPVLQACSLSLCTRMPLVLRQTEQLIESADGQREARIVGKMRSTLALVRARQYLDSIQEGMDPESNEGLDEQLRTVLAGLDTDSLPEDFRHQRLSFRVSPWIATALCFDLPLGASAQWHTSPQETHGTQLPIQVEVEPVVEFRAHDLASVRAARAAARACTVVIEKCSHEARAVNTGAGMIGEATIRVHVRPTTTRSGEQLQVWGSDRAVQSLCVKEARA